MKIANPVARIGEDLASEYLQKHKYKILERNFRKGYGEIDIVAVKDSILVFVEVKTRTSSAYGTPLESISYFKLRTLLQTAQFYKLLHKKLPDAMRMDAISVILTKDNELVTIEHIRNITQ